MKLQTDLIGLDLGMSTTGIARINVQARIAEPLEPFSMKDIDSLVAHVSRLITNHQASAVVVGVPRSLQGADTAQTAWSAKVVEVLSAELNVPVHTIDEAGTTKLAEQRARNSESVDSVAAGIILEDFLEEVIRGNIKNVSI